MGRGEDKNIRLFFSQIRQRSVQATNIFKPQIDDGITDFEFAELRRPLGPDEFRRCGEREYDCGDQDANESVEHFGILRNPDRGESPQILAIGTCQIAAGCRERIPNPKEKV